MKNTIIGVVMLLVLVVGGWYWYQNYTPPGEGFGTYAYQCTNGAQFTLTMNADVSRVELTPGMNATFGAGTYTRSATQNNRFESGSNYFTGAGEEVQLVVGNTMMVCNPVPNPNEPPFNWGDPGEGGGIQPDVTVVVFESIQGKWRSTDDAKYVREFQTGGTVADLYEGKVVSQGTYTVYTKERPLAGVTIPLETGKVYVQLKMAGTQQETLNFSVGKLTPEELELVYLERGGVLRYSAVQ